MRFLQLLAAFGCVGLMSAASQVHAETPVQAQVQRQAAPGAAALSGTLAKIKHAGAITFGVREGSVPFSYLDDKQQYQGYSIELCSRIVLALQKQLGVVELKIAMNPVTAANRIPLMANGTIDLECGSTTNNLERQRQVAFAPTMFVISNRLLTKKAANIKSLADLRGKTLVATAGTATLKQMTILNKVQNLGMTIAVAKDHPEAFLMLDTGRAAAEANDDILLASQVASARNPAQYEIGAEALSLEPYGIMMRKGDPAFKQAVDAALIAIYKSGEIERIYAKWFQAPIPPKGINLNFAMPAALKAVIATPTDSGDPAAYGTVPAAQQAASGQP